MTKTKTKTTMRPASHSGDVDSVVEALRRRAAPATVDELRDAIGGSRDDARRALERAIAAGRARLAEPRGEALFSAPRFEICPTGKALRREIEQRLSPPPRSSRAPDLPRDVTRAALEISGGRGRRVMLTDLRRALPAIGRRELDELLVAMSREGVIALFPNDDRHSITDADRRDAVSLSGVPQHILYLP